MKTNDEPAFPSIELDSYSGKPCGQNLGLSKREVFAMAAMQGLLSASDELAGKTMNEHFRNIARMAVGNADALIEELNKKE